MSIEKPDPGSIGGNESTPAASSSHFQPFTPKFAIDSSSPICDEEGNIFLPVGEWTLGRHRSNHIVLPNANVSRRHATLTRSSSSLEVLDLNSRNGTLVNGTRIQDSPLCPGDIIGFGAVEFRVYDGSWLLVRDVVTDSTAEQSVSPDAHLVSTVLLTPAQQRVFELLLTGCTEAEIARQLGSAVPTVHSHVMAIYRAYGVKSRAALLAHWLQQGDWRRG